MAKRKPSEARLLQQIATDIAEMLPPTWSLDTVAEAGRGRPDFTMRFVGPDGSEGTVIVEAKRSLNRGDVPSVLQQLRGYAESDQSEDIALGGDGSVSQRVGPRAHRVRRRELLRLHRQRPVGVAPALALHPNDGSGQGPLAVRRRTPQLEGSRHRTGPPGDPRFRSPVRCPRARHRADVPLGSLSRTIDFLNREGLIERSGRKPITDVDWQGVIRRWAKDYGVSSSNQIATYLGSAWDCPTSRGKLEGRKRGLRNDRCDRRSTLRPDCPDPTGRRLRQRRQQMGRSTRSPRSRRRRQRLAHRAISTTSCSSEPSRATAWSASTPPNSPSTCLTGPGRDPAEGDELLTWMERNQDAWRTR